MSKDNENKQKEISAYEMAESAGSLPQETVIQLMEQIKKKDNKDSKDK